MEHIRSGQASSRIQTNTCVLLGYYDLKRKIYKEDEFRVSGVSGFQSREPMTRLPSQAYHLGSAKIYEGHIYIAFSKTPFSIYFSQSSPK